MQLLKNKLLEEAQEVYEAKSYEDLMEEIGDVYDVLLGIMHELKIKKRSLNKIMILSNSEPEEQILFSLYICFICCPSFLISNKGIFSGNSLFLFLVDIKFSFGILKLYFLSYCSFTPLNNDGII